MRIPLLTLLFAFLSMVLHAQDVYQKQGKYWKGTTLYTGVLTEKNSEDVIITEVGIKNGMLDGKTTEYYPNGMKKEERSYKNGKKDGLWISYTDKEVKTGEARYKNDLKDGLWIVWDPAGKKRFEFSYLLGKKSGKWTMWDDAGQVLMEKKF